MKNLYTILGIHQNAFPSEIKKAYRKLAKKYHPDSSANDKNTAEKFKEVTEAYTILGDEKRKKEYDAQRSNQKTNATKSNQQSHQERRTNTITNTINVDFEFEKFFGFHAKAADKGKDFANSNKKNPMDTTNIFESFFQVKRT